MVDGKVKFALWLTPECRKEVRDRYRADNLKSQSEFIERAIWFYCDYCNAENSKNYLPDTVSSTLEGVLLQFGDRLGQLLFKQAVELAMMGRIIAARTDYDEDTIRELREETVRAVARTHGQLSFRDLLRFRGVEL